MKYGQSKPFLLGGSFIFLFLTALLDYFTGNDFRVFVLYYLLIYFTTIHFGKTWGFVFLVITIITGFSISILLHNPLISPSAKYWNASIRLIILAIIVEVTSRRKTTLEREKNLRLQLEKQSQELFSTNRDLRNLTYSIVHDIKNPVTIISAFCDILKEAEPKLNTEQKDALSRIIFQTQRIFEIINDLLRLTRIGTQGLNLSIVNLSEIAASVSEELKFVYSNTRYEISIQPQMYATCDVGLIRLLLTNLIGNAMKFTIKSESPKIWIGVTERIEKSGEKVYFVKDNGIGFDQKKSQSIFEPFVRLHSPKDFPGTGIGLAIVRRIIEKHNGKTWTSSEPGKGTTVYYTLNLKPDLDDSVTRSA